MNEIFFRSKFFFFFLRMDQLICLRSIPTEKIFLLLDPVTYNFPVIDGTILQAQILNMFTNQIYKQNTPLIIGSNAQEGNLFAFEGANNTFEISEELYLKEIDRKVEGWGPSVAQQVINYYADDAQQNGKKKFLFGIIFFFIKILLFPKNFFFFFPKIFFTFNI